jgi:hypothetical protein
MKGATILVILSYVTAIASFMVDRLAPYSDTSFDIMLELTILWIIMSTAAICLSKNKVQVFFILLPSILFLLTPIEALLLAVSFRFTGFGG